MRERAVSAAFKALADPTRRRLFERIVSAGELSISKLTEGSGISQPAVSQHIAALKSAGLVSSRREGRLAHYGVRKTGLAPLADWMTTYGVFWQKRFERLERLLEEMDE